MSEVVWVSLSLANLIRDTKHFDHGYLTRRFGPGKLHLMLHHQSWLAVWRKTNAG